MTDTDIPTRSPGDSTCVITAPRGSAYSVLSRQVKQAGLLDRRPGYYAALISLVVALGAAGFTALLMIGNSWWQLLVAGYFAVVSTQLGFLGHDAGHRQIFRSVRGNHRLGVVLANLGVGFSYGWWVDKHNRHHAHPNDEDKDPDIGAGALVFTTRQAQAGGRVARAFHHYQAWMFFPLLSLEAVSLRVASVRYLLADRDRSRMREALLIALHFVACLAVVVVVLPPGKALAFVAIHEALFGLYLGCCFAPNHKGMPTLTAADNADYLRRQVLTSRNVRGHWLTDFVLGGLNYQIEHHLFPSMPRGNLRRAQRLVKDFCASQRVPYLETGLISSYAQALRHLDTVGGRTGG
ncbi:fatty acid desaturase family protein [Actinoplanes regularis]|uniref:fatty acid desaturase family protein n=1 Tax=Actinoplanes regularis TaxID=52697 RepID=UPI0024A32CCE|nr:acyl-CoA desaturase [Actinoplanes regularis]GLW32879.1 delta fatty acid desaturase [Actinoplanes regularis]